MSMTRVVAASGSCWFVAASLAFTACAPLATIAADGEGDSGTTKSSTSQGSDAGTNQDPPNPTSNANADANASNNQGAEDAIAPTVDANIGAVDANQPATGNDNPGAPGVATELATGANQNVGELAYAGNSVYWTSYVPNGAQPNGAVNAVPMAGGPTSTIVSQQDVSVGLAVRDGDVYWVDVDPTANTLSVMGLHNGVTTTLATGITSVTDLAVDDTYVYWCNEGTYDKLFVDGALMRVPRAGGSTSVVLSPTTNPYALAVDANNIYWTDYSTSTLYEMPLAGGTPLALASPVQYFTIDTKYAYYANYLGTGMGAIAKVALSGGNPTILASDLTYPSYIAVDGTNAYWTGYVPNGVPSNGAKDYGVMSVSLNGGTPSVLVSGQIYYAIVATGSDIFFATDTAVWGMTLK
jgi:hypothetical protein